MGFDPDIANWILEFYLRHPLEDRTLNALLRTLPLPSDNPNLRKLLLLKKLELEVSRLPVSESALDLMEQLAEVEFRRENEAVSDAMKRAYCAVVLECTLRHVKIGKDGRDNGRTYEFFKTVKRVWRGRMEKVSVEGGLGSELLWEWKDMIEMAWWDDSACERVLKKFEGVNVVEAVMACVREEREKMGPSFLELVAEAVKNEDGLQKLMGGDGIDQSAVKEAPSCHVDMAAGGSNPSEVHKQKIELRDKPVDLRHPRGMSSSSSRGAKIGDSDETAGGPSSRNCSSPLSTEVNKAQEALKLTSLELRAAVKDPLPDALRVAEEISNDAKQNEQDDPAEGNDGRPELFIVDAGGVVQSRDGNTSNVPRRSLMERNSTARTYEWDDSIDGSQEDVACRVVVQVPSPKRIKTSPLRIYEMNNVKKRRKGRRWSVLEEDTLRAGVETHGRGNWKVILMAYRDIFEGRTEVDLKDKWRNLTRYS